MTSVFVPIVWLIVFTVGLPQLSETIYTPALPDIAKSLQTSEAFVEYTLTIYLFGFAIGTLFWGKLSDRLGRKPCILLGIVVFILGSLGCYYSSSIGMLLLSRLIQAFGGSIGSVLGQAVCRDVFHGPALGRMYSAIGSALAVFPAIGPVIGGFLSENYGWQSVFPVLVVFAVILMLLVMLCLPETYPADQRRPVALGSVAMRMVRDKKVIGFGLIVAGCNGIIFSYYAEGSFYLIDLLGMSPSAYGLSFIAIALSTMLGGYMSKRMQHLYTSDKIMNYGIWAMILGSAVLAFVILLQSVLPLPDRFLVLVTIITQMLVMFGTCMAASNALAGALGDYKDCIGTALSLFGCFYYAMIALFTFGMGSLHDGTLYPMPLYFLAIGCFMLLVRKLMIQGKAVSLNA